jgi:hypothetical protein
MSSAPNALTAVSSFRVSLLLSSGVEVDAQEIPFHSTTRVCESPLVPTAQTSSSGAKVVDGVEERLLPGRFRHAHPFPRVPVPMLSERLIESLGGPVGSNGPCLIRSRAETPATVPPAPEAVPAPAPEAGVRAPASPTSHRAP